MKPTVITRDVVIARPRGLVAEAWHSGIVADRSVGRGPGDRQALFRLLDLPAPPWSEADPYALTWEQHGIQGSLHMWSVTPGVTIVVVALKVPHRRLGTWFAARTGLLSHRIDILLARVRDIVEAHVDPTRFVEHATG